MKKRMWVSMFIAGILLFSLSQNAKGDDRRALAEELLNVKQIQQIIGLRLALFQRMMMPQVNNIVKSMGQDVPAPATAMQEVMFALITEEMSWDKMKDDLISVYADIYTEEELKAQIDFYRSPVSQAVAGKDLELSGKVMELSQKRMMQIMPKIQAMMKESMGKEGYAPVPPASEAQYRCLQNLKQLGLAVQMFAGDNGGKFPENPSLLQGYSVDSSTLTCPGNKAKPARSSYIYVKGLSVRDDSQAPVMYDSSADNHGGKGRNVLFVDGHVAYYYEKDFQAFLQKFMTEYKDRITLVEVGTPALVEKTVTEPQKDNTGKEKAAVAVAEKWLTMVDKGKYAESWEETAEYFKAAVKQEQWEQSLQAVRKPFGELVSRKVTSASYKTSLPGAPDGEYVVIQFEASFENKKSSIETITPMMDKDGKWRVSGYYIK